MNVTSTSNFRKQIKHYIDQVDKNQEPLVVTRVADDVAVVVLPLATYNAYAETDYLLRAPANAKHLRASLRSATHGDLKKHNLAD